MPIDATIPLQAQGVDPLRSMQNILQPLSTLTSIRNANTQNQIAQQVLKQQQFETQRQDQSNAERQAMTKFLQSPDSKGDDGQLDLTKVSQFAAQNAPQTGHEWVNHVASIKQDQLAIKEGTLKLSNEQRRDAAGMFAALANKPNLTPDDVQTAFSQYKEAYPDSSHLVDTYAKYLPNNLEGTRQMLRTDANALIPAEGQGVQTGAVSTGGATQLYQTNPYQPGVVSPAGGFQNTLGPGTTVWDPSQNRMVYLGNPSLGAGPQAGQESAIGGSVETINKDWAQTQDQAKNVQQNLSVLQTIKQHAPGAITGAQSDRLALANGIATLVGIPAAELAKTDTDLLAKNANMLALAGGNTDSARALAEAANPNTHMSKEAIIKAVDQISAQQKMMLAKQKYLAPFKSQVDRNPSIGIPAYNDALTHWNQAADPRVLQYKTMSPQEKADLKKSMNEQERQEFGSKLKHAQDLGIIE